MNIKSIVIVAGLAMAVGGVAQAQDFSPKSAGTRILNVRVTAVAPDAGDAIRTTAGASTGLKATVSDTVVPSVGLTYFLTDNWAVEAIAATSKHTIRAKGGATNVKVQETWVLPPVVSLQYHFAPAARMSPYLGAGVNYMLFYSAKDTNGFGLKVKDGFGYAVQAGVDVVVRENASINVDVKKVFFDTSAVDRANGLRSHVNLDPWVISGGVGFRF